MKRFLRKGMALAAALTLATATVAQSTGADPLGAASASDQAQSLPRVTPRELMPRNWFGATPEGLGPSMAPSAGDDGGSARSRLVRDVRRGDTAGVANQDPRRAQPRAGSALSSNPPRTGAEASSVAAKNSRLARSIAAEAAEAISGAGDSRPVRNPPQVDEDGAQQGPVELLEPIPAQGAAAGRAAEGTAGKVRIATAGSGPTKLPMVVGEGPTTIRRPTTLGAAINAPENATAAGPSEPSGALRASQPGEPIEDDLLLTQRMPVLVSKVAGPRTIVVGREALYRVLLANRGDVAADQVETLVTIPASAEVVGSKASVGSIEPSATPGQFVWKTKRLGAGDMAKLDLRLVARTGSPVELAVTHSHRPVDGRTRVEVQEPKLALTLVGPDQVQYGKPQVFRLTITNPGTGVAEGVVLHLTPPGNDPSKRTSHDFGALAAGEERAVEIELTAREAGQLAINAAAVADGGLTAEAVKEVFCRKPELAVELRGPADRYAGSPAVYLVRVTNPGTATAPDVVVEVELPAGFEVLPGVETPTVRGGKLTYLVGTMAEGGERVLELRGVLRQAGANTLAATAAASDDTRSAPTTFATEVVALADLKLDVLDPKGPIPTDQEIAYEIRITNRGSSDAHDVRVIGLFSEGIEPHHAEGGASKMNDGRVAFDTIERLAAGEERTFTIHARAYNEGTHLFRAEVLCRDLEIKLAAEETTRFYKDEAVSVAGDGYPTNPLAPR